MALPTLKRLFAYGPAGESGDRLRNDQLDEKVVIPSGGLSPKTDGVFARRVAEQVVCHVFDDSEVGRGIVGPHTALIIPESHVHDPMQAVLDRPVPANGGRNLLGR